MTVAEYRTQLNEASARLQFARTSCTNLRKELSIAKKEVAAAKEAQELVQQVAQSVQQTAHNQIAGAVGRCLRVVFDEPYEFKIIWERKRGRTEARLVFVRDGLEVDPLDAAGGGVVDVAAFALRLSCLALSHPHSRMVLVLDEPFKNVSKSRGYLERIPQLLVELCEDLGVQIIMVTHIDELRIGLIVELD